MFQRPFLNMCNSLCHTKIHTIFEDWCIHLNDFCFGNRHFAQPKWHKNGKWNVHLEHNWNPPDTSANNAFKLIPNSVQFIVSDWTFDQLVTHAVTPVTWWHPHDSDFAVFEALPNCCHSDDVLVPWLIANFDLTCQDMPAGQNTHS